MNVDDVMAALAELPLMLTLAEAAAILRIGRTSAYDEANEYEASGGRRGIPVIRIGRLFRVPRWALAFYLVNGRPPRLGQFGGDIA